jgi:hypothetical protein
MRMLKNLVDLQKYGKKSVAGERFSLSLSLA